MTNYDPYNELVGTVEETLTLEQVKDLGINIDPISN